MHVKTPVLLALAVVWVSIFPSGPSSASSDKSVVISVVDRGTGGDVGMANSLALDSNGNPVVSYADRTDHQLTLLHCRDTNCEGDRSIALPDKSAAPYTTSLAVGPDNLPVVAYAGLSLNLLRCKDPDCLDGVLTTLAPGPSIFTVSLALDRNSRPVIAYADARLGHLAVLRCNDTACTSSEVVSTDTDGPVTDVVIRLDSEDRPTIAYADDGILKLMSCVATTCSTGTTHAQPVPTSGDCCRIAGPKLALDSEGRPIISYREVRGLSTLSLKLLRCGDRTCSAGNSVVTLDESGNIGPSTAMAIDDQDRPALAYWGSGGLNLLRCGDPDCLARNSSQAALDAGLLSGDLSLALDNDASPVLAFGLDGDLHLLHCRDVNCVGGSSVVTADRGTFSGIVGGSSSLRLDSMGLPVIAYSDSLDNQLKVAYCGDVACSVGNVIRILVDNVAPTFVSLVLDGAGRPVVSFYDELGTDLVVVRCADPRCATDPSIARPDTAGDVGAFNSLALDQYSRPAISYMSVTPLEMRLLRCGDEACSAGNSITVPDPQRFVGAYTSLALDSDGNAVIAYQDWQYQRLRVMHCADPFCAENPVITSIGRNGSGGAATSLVLDATGRPVIAFAANVEGSNALRVVRCGNSSCSSGNTLVTLEQVDDYVPGIALALDGQGHPVVSHFSRPAMRLLRCGDPYCAAGNTVDTFVHSESPTNGSLQLDEHDQPVLSYSEATRGNLDVVLCQKPGCLPGASPIKPGDADCSGSVDSIDASVILQFEAGLMRQRGCLVLGDLNSDSAVNAVDAMLVLQRTAAIKQPDLS